MNSAMRFTLERLSQPEFEPVTLAEIIEHVNEFSNLAQSKQDELTGHIVAAREWAEDYTGSVLIDQTWRLTLHGRSLAGGDTVSGTRDGALPVGYGYYSGLCSVGNGALLLRKYPALAITSLKSVDGDGVETTLAAATYQLREVDSKWPRVVALSGATWGGGTSGDLRLTFRAGFADQLGSPGEGPEVVPACFKQAIKLRVQAMYDRDEKMMPLLIKVAEELLKPHRAHLQVA